MCKFNLRYLIIDSYFYTTYRSNRSDNSNDNEVQNIEITICYIWGTHNNNTVKNKNF